MVQKRWRGATPCPKPRVAAVRSHPTSKVRGSGREEPPHARSQGRRPGGATPGPRSSGCTSAVGLEKPSHEKVRKGGGEEIPLIQGKEQ